MADEPNQPLQTSSLSGFEGLDGINPVRETRDRETTNLNILLEIEAAIINRRIRLSNIPNINFDYYGYESWTSCYKELYTKSCNELRSIEFTENDLESFILAKTDSDYDFVNSVLLGLYSGALLQILTERNNAKEKRTKVYVNGNRGNFDFLFSFARVVDELIIENFTGNCIGTKIGHNSGSAHRIIGRGLEGAHIFESAGKNKGNVEQLIGIGLRGNYLMCSLGNIDGNISQIIGVDINGVEVLSDSGSHRARISQLIGIEIKGVPFRGVCRNDGKIYHLLCIDVNGHYLNDNWPHIAHKMTSFLSPPYSPTEPIFHEEGIGGYKLSPENKSAETIAIAKSLKDAPYPKILEIADELYALRPAVPEGFFGGN